MSEGSANVAFAHTRELTPDVVWAIATAWGEEALRSWERDVDLLRNTAGKVAAGEHGTMAVYVPRGLARAGEELVMCKFWPSHTGVVDRSSKYFPDVRVKLLLPSLHAPKFRYGTLTATPAGGIHVWDRNDSRTFAETARRVREILGAHFAFGESELELTIEGTEDPRVRAWGLTYYGKDLVDEIGHARLASAPAHNVQFDGEGGCWLELVELPFVASPEKEKAREAVEAHLGLRERFGGDR